MVDPLPSVSIGGQQFPLHTAYVDFLTDMKRVAPGKTAIAYLNYSAFNIPASLDSATKVLNLDPKAVVCPS